MITKNGTLALFTSKASFLNVVVKNLAISAMLAFPTAATSSPGGITAPNESRIIRFTSISLETILSKRPSFFLPTKAWVLASSLGSPNSISKQRRPLTAKSPSTIITLEVSNPSCSAHSTLNVFSASINTC